MNICKFTYGIQKQRASKRIIPLNVPNYKDVT